MTEKKKDHRIGNTNGKVDEPKSSYIQIRVSPRAKAGYVKQAQREDTNLSEWVVKLLDAAIDDDL